MTPIELRVLAYLDQHGPTHRSEVIAALASDQSRVARGIVNGSNGAAPLIMGKWCARLIRQGLVLQVQRHDGFYLHHAITSEGRRALRSSGDQK